MKNKQKYDKRGAIKRTRFLYFEGELVLNSSEEQYALCDRIEKFIREYMKKYGYVSVYRVIETF